MYNLWSWNCYFGSHPQTQPIISTRRKLTVIWIINSIFIVLSMKRQKNVKIFHLKKSKVKADIFQCVCPKPTHSPELMFLQTTDIFKTWLWDQEKIFFLALKYLLWLPQTQQEMSWLLVKTTLVPRQQISRGFRRTNVGKKSGLAALLPTCVCGLQKH